MKKENIHAGHRKRMREQMAKHGFDIFNDHQKLELILFRTIRRRDTNPTAHYLVNAYGNFAQVCDTPYKDLLKIKGIGPKSARLIKQIPRVAKFVNYRREPGILFNDHGFICEYITSNIETTGQEEMLIATIDNQMRLVKLSRACSGENCDILSNYSRLFKLLCEANTKRYMIIHFLNGKSCISTAESIAYVRKVVKDLSRFGVEILEFIRCGNDGYNFAISNRSYALSKEKNIPKFSSED